MQLLFEPRTSSFVRNSLRGVIVWLSFTATVWVFTSPETPLLGGDLNNHSSVVPGEASFVPGKVGVQFVLLPSDRVLSGELHRHQGNIVLRRIGRSTAEKSGTEQGEITLRSSEVIGVASSLSELYQIRKQAKPTQGAFRNAGERVSEWLDDARWCIEYELAAEATQNLMRVYQVNPNHPIALQLESRLRRQNRQRAPDGSTNKILSHEPNDSGSIAQVGFEQPITGSSEDAGVKSLSQRESNDDQRDAVHEAIAAQLGREHLHFFTGRIQPILLSRCGSCHQTGDSATMAWTLAVPIRGARPSRRFTLENLISTLSACRSQDGDMGRDVEATTFWNKATSPHGFSESVSARPPVPPIAAHETQLLASLKAWLESLPQGVDFQSASLTAMPPAMVASALSKPPRSDKTTKSKESISLPDGSVQRLGVGMQTSDIRPLRHTDQTSELPTNSAKTSHADSGTDTVIGPQRLPVVKNPLSVERFNRQTELIERFKNARIDFVE